MNLLEQKCVPCEGGVDPMTKADAESMRDFHVADWEIDEEGKHISKKFTFKNFKEALEFVNKVGAIAESEGHHPDIELGWGRVVITLTTHAIKGLSQNDFIVAAKLNNIARE
ncbi:4a-hydroxytetrahydrobiopterin dehydratase [Candidatus Nomurabacteria bacterium]|nr:4a-hydroxytetrahydrobiopterin dehydratase [Candidatus Nomurabacteria bacterium]